MLNYNLFLFLRVTINKIMMDKISSKTIPAGNQKLISAKLNRFEELAVVIPEPISIDFCVIVSLELTACDELDDSLETAACIDEFFEAVFDDTICEDEASAVELAATDEAATVEDTALEDATDATEGVDETVEEIAEEAFDEDATVVAAVSTS